MLDIGIVCLDENLLTTPKMHELMLTTLKRTFQNKIFPAGSGDNQQQKKFYPIRLHVMFLPDGGNLAGVDFAVRLKKEYSKDFKPAINVYCLPPAAITGKGGAEVFSDVDRLHPGKNWQTFLTKHESLVSVTECASVQQARKCLLEKCQILIGFTTNTMKLEQSWIKDFHGYVIDLLDVDVCTTSQRTPYLGDQLQKNWVKCGRKLIRRG